MVKGSNVEWRRKPGYRVGESDRRTTENGSDGRYSKNLRIPVLTLVALVFPLRRFPGAVRADSVSESSETSSEHHCMGANGAKQKKSQVMTTLSKDRLIKAQIRIPQIRKQDTRARS